MKSIALTFISFLFCVQVIQANVIVLNGLTHSYSGVSGQTFQGQVVLANTSNVDQRVTFSLSEAIYSCDAERVFAADVLHKNSATNWFESSIMDKVLGPKERYIFKYNITVPNDQALKGSFWTTLMINVEKPILEEVVSDFKIGSKVRYAVRLLADVNINDDVQLDFESADIVLNTISTTRQLDIKIRNQNTFIENVRLSLEFYDVYGNLVLETETKRLKAFPETCKIFSLDISKLPVGTYQCVAIVDSRDEYVGTNLSLTID
ncbi:hypothetical protein [Mariniflexile sp. AS56]|uniref:hypothetical protein n=1 Tax=Mariniflexile sp. AS56 TaxID=3063957 RepID=UPI0026F19F0C|nr:hypothetical protein [Mariniflexile sp. AS56]MDO7171534.1 hypothetical protein [Mariniflexile sp. AS56]